jgi:hypothetical protein
MDRAISKTERLLQVGALLLAYPRGLTQAEIAQRLRITSTWRMNHSTIRRYVPDLDWFGLYETDDGRLAIDRDHYSIACQHHNTHSPKRWLCCWPSRQRGRYQGLVQSSCRRVFRSRSSTLYFGTGRLPTQPRTGSF